MKINQKQHITRRGVVKRNPEKKNFSNKLQIFSGHYKGKIDGKIQDLDFNLYNNEGLNYNKTKEAIMYNMNRKHLGPMRVLFAKAGLTLKKFQWYSPNAYNYSGDGVDLVISVSDRELLKRFIIHHSKEIQTMLDANTSYDGYMATTSSDIKEIIEKIDKDFDIDIMVISFIQSLYVMDMYNDLFDLYVNEDEEN